MASVEEIQEQVRSRYAAAAVAVSQGDQRDQACGCADPGCGEPGCCQSNSSDSSGSLGHSGSSAGCCGAVALDQDSAVFGSGLYVAGEQGELPVDAVLASLGCGNPVAVADLHPGETVLDLGSGGGIDVLLSAKRVGPDGFAYGVDMTEEMLQLAWANAAKAGAGNVEFLHGTIENVPLPDASVDVVISNCVINLSGDKPQVLAEMFRVLKPGGRIGVSDVVAEDHLSPADRAKRGSFSGCIAGALSKQEYLDGLAAAGFSDSSVRFTHEAEPQMHAAIIQATKPATEPGQASQPASACCSTGEQATCCELDAKAECCGTTDGAASGTPGASSDVSASTSCGCR